LAEQTAEQDFHENPIAGAELGELDAHTLAGDHVAYDCLDVYVATGDFKADPQAGSDARSVRLCYEEATHANRLDTGDSLFAAAVP